MPGTSPRVTWLLPVRDAMPYLPETLASLEAQTFRDFEVLAWDNGSRDDSVATLQRWIPGRLPGRVVLDRPQPRLGGCLAAMLLEARGELIARIDGDDVNEPERLARQVAALDRQPDWLGVGSAHRPIDAAGQLGPVADHYPRDPQSFRWELFFKNPLPHPTACLRREAVLAAGNYADMGTGQDWDLWFRMALRGPLANLSEPLLRYRSHDASVSARHHSEWPEIGRTLATRYAGELFPGVSTADAMAVWRFLSPRSPERGRGTAPSPKTIYQLAQAAARGAGWTQDAVASTPVVRAQMWACFRQQPAWLGDWLAVRMPLGARTMIDWIRRSPHSPWVS